MKTFKRFQLLIIVLTAVMLSNVFAATAFALIPSQGAKIQATAATCDADLTKATTKKIVSEAIAAGKDPEVAAYQVVLATVYGAASANCDITAAAQAASSGAIQGVVEAAIAAGQNVVEAAKAAGSGAARGAAQGSLNTGGNADDLADAVTQGATQGAQQLEKNFLGLERGSITNAAREGTREGQDKAGALKPEPVPEPIPEPEPARPPDPDDQAGSPT